MKKFRRNRTARVVPRTKTWNFQNSKKFKYLAISGLDVLYLLRFWYPGLLILRNTGSKIGVI